MKEANFQEVALFEHRFWLQVLGDHARFIFDNLSPKETKEIEQANRFICIFDKLLEEARKPLKDTEVMALTNQAYHYAHEIRLFKLDLIRQHLIGDIELGLPPTFINHMVNEVEEYLRVLAYLMTSQIPVSTAIHNHLVWLLDAAGHAAGIAGDLDMVEKRLTEQSQLFTQRFEEFYIKAVEMAGYMRTCLETFPAFDRFNLQVEGEIQLFKVFLRELEEMELGNKVLGTLSALMLDHMAREECYYLIKLAEASNVRMPDCDPTKPRTEG
ncbi:DUF2935 domain-containing protein [Clostridium aceticum]|uniref:DUF2935 domain-containing protein n=1 Tax=Clostridium aceticum TaxID=84022 RepID=UPI0005CF0666|nr:DUF2935 domain-containing protein [Clostridium aceticum]KJF28441.1 hypothetical protein TZ02_00465 [Clostridium aceticum]